LKVYPCILYNIIFLLFICIERIKKVQDTVNDSIRNIKRQVMTLNHDRIKTGNQIKLEAAKQDTKVLYIQHIVYILIFSY
jgi:hypothetical protein